MPFKTSHYRVILLENPSLFGLTGQVGNLPGQEDCWWFVLACGAIHTRGDRGVSSERRAD